MSSNKQLITDSPSGHTDKFSGLTVEQLSVWEDQLIAKINQLNDGKIGTIDGRNRAELLSELTHITELKNKLYGNKPKNLLV